MSNYINNPQLLIEEENLNRLYQKLGEKVFKEMRDKDNSVSSQAFFEGLMNSAMEYCVEITDKIKLIEAYNHEPDSDDIVNDDSVISAGKKCGNCGNICEEDSVFCGCCGWSFKADDDSASDAADGALLFCTECGAQLDADSIFCTNCGNRVE